MKPQLRRRDGRAAAGLCSSPRLELLHCPLASDPKHRLRAPASSLLTFCRCRLLNRIFDICDFDVGLKPGGQIRRKPGSTQSFVKQTSDFLLYIFALENSRAAEIMGVITRK